MHPFYLYDTPYVLSTTLLNLCIVHWDTGRFPTLIVPRSPLFFHLSLSNLCPDWYLLLFLAEIISPFFLYHGKSIGWFLPHFLLRSLPFFSSNSFFFMCQSFLLPSFPTNSFILVVYFTYNPLVLIHHLFYSIYQSLNGPSLFLEDSSIPLLPNFP